MFMIYGMVGSSMGFSLHLPHLMGPTCAIAAWCIICDLEDKTQADDWASKGARTTQA